MKILPSLSLATALCLVAAVQPPLNAQDDPIADALHATDMNNDGSLSSAEVTAGLRRPLNLKPGQDSSALQKSLARFRKVFGPGPGYTLQELASNPDFSEDIFGLTVVPKPPKAVNTTDKWVPGFEKPFRLRRTFKDFLEHEKKAALGANISYTNDLDAKSEQWAFHGVAGLVLHETRNVHLGQDAKGLRPEVDTTRDFGVRDRWVIPSVQWDKVTTSQSDADEVDRLIYRLTTGVLYHGKNFTGGVLDSFRFNMSGGYATQSKHRSGILTGEIDLTPIVLEGKLLGLGLNSTYQKVGWFGIRPELKFHAEGSTVTKDGGLRALTAQEDFLRVGFNAGLSIKFEEQVTERFHVLRRLLFHTGLDYYVDVTDSGPDVDLFTASADLALDDDGDYTLSIEYRDGRAPLVLDRYHDVTVSLSVRF